MSDFSTADLQLLALSPSDVDTPEELASMKAAGIVPDASNGNWPDSVLYSNPAPVTQALSNPWLWAVGAGLVLAGLLAVSGD